MTASRTTLPCPSTASLVLSTASWATAGRLKKTKTTRPAIQRISLLSMQFGVSQSHIVLQAGRVWDGVAGILCGNLPCGCDLVDTLAGFLRCFHIVHEFAIEVHVLLQVVHSHLRTVAGDNNVRP